MRSFEERFAAFGRAIDRVIDRLRHRRPKRFERRAGPTLREQAHERARNIREFFSEGEWRQAMVMDERGRRRLIVLGCVLGMAVAVAAPFWMLRGMAHRPTVEELVNQALVKKQLELASRAEQANMGSWNAGPAAGARTEPGSRKWGP